MNFINSKFATIKSKILEHKKLSIGLVVFFVIFVFYVLSVISNLSTSNIPKTKNISRIVNEETQKFVKNNPVIFPPESAELYAYTSNAYLDCISQKLNPTSCGSMSINLIYLIYKGQEVNFSDLNYFPNFSINLKDFDKASNIFSKYSERIASDPSYFEIYSGKVPDGTDKWKSDVNKPPYAANAGSWKRWNYDNSTTFAVPKPIDYSSPEFENEKNVVQGAVEKRDANWVNIINKWGGTPGTEQPAGIWQNDLYSVNESTAMSDLDYATIQAKLASAIADSFLEVWKVKYLYWTARPSQIIPGLETAMPNPNFPSYVSGHSTISATAATILSKLIPTQAAKWIADAIEAKDSRLYAGIHYPMDLEVGYQLGINVARQIQSLPQNEIAYPLPTFSNNSSSDSSTNQQNYGKFSDWNILTTTTSKTAKENVNASDTANKSWLYILRNKNTGDKFPFIKTDNSVTDLGARIDGNVFEIVNANQSHYWSAEECAGKPSFFLGDYIVSEEGNQTYFDVTLHVTGYGDQFSVYDIKNDSFIYFYVPSTENIYAFGFSYVGKNQFRVISPRNNKFYERIVDLGTKKYKERELFGVTDQIWNGKNKVNSNVFYADLNNSNRGLIVNYSEIPQEESVRYSSKNLNFTNTKIGYYLLDSTTISKLNTKDDVTNFMINNTAISKITIPISDSTGLMFFKQSNQ